MADNANGTALVYTDGGCIGNPGPGGYAALIVVGTEEQVIKGRAFQVPVQRPVQANRQVIGVSRDGKDGSVIARAPSGRVAGP